MLVAESVGWHAPLAYECNSLFLARNLCSHFGEVKIVAFEVLSGIILLTSLRVRWNVLVDRVSRTFPLDENASASYGKHSATDRTSIRNIM